MVVYGCHVCLMYSWKIVLSSCISTMEHSVNIAVISTLRRPWLNSGTNLMDSLTSMQRAPTLQQLILPLLLNIVSYI